MHRKLRATLTTSTACYFLLGCAGGPPAESPPPLPAPAISTTEPRETTAAANTRPARMLRLVLRLTATGPEIVSVNDAPNSLSRRDPLRRAPTFFRARSASGELLFERGFALADELNVDVRAPDGSLSGAHAPLAVPVFTIAVPRFPELAVIELYRAADGSRQDPTLIGEVRP